MGERLSVEPLETFSLLVPRLLLLPRLFSRFVVVVGRSLLFSLLLGTTSLRDDSPLDGVEGLLDVEGRSDAEGLLGAEDLCPDSDR